MKKATSALDVRNRDMRLILDTVQQGFITVDLRGALSSERSAVLDTWFGPPRDGEDLFAWIARVDADFSSWLRLSFDTITDDVLPIEVALAQMPQQWKYADRAYELAWLLLPERAGLLLTISDVTAVLKAAADEASRQEMAAIVERLMRDRQAVAEFVHEADELVQHLTHGHYDNAVHARRLAHTLKGNAAFFGLRRLAEAAHEFEAGFTDDGVADTTAIATLWRETSERVQPFLGDDPQVQVSLADLEYLNTMVRAGASADEIVEVVESYRAEPATRRLQRLAEQVLAVGQRLGKPIDVEVVTEQRVRVPAQLRAFWSAAIHLLRNAVDHGIEDAAERAARHKSPTGHIRLSATQANGDFIVEVSDDGGGINWDGLRNKARELGLPADTEADLVNALFADGVSTRSEATDVSGRGVGMAAVRQVVIEHHGEIAVSSRRGQGTTFTMRFPLRSLPGEQHEAVAH